MAGGSSGLRWYWIPHPRRLRSRTPCGPSAVRAWLVAGSAPPGQARVSRDEQDDLDHVLARLEDPDFRFIAGVPFGAWGRRPPPARGRVRPPATAAPRPDHRAPGRRRPGRAPRAHASAHRKPRSTSFRACAIASALEARPTSAAAARATWSRQSRAVGMPRAAGRVTVSVDVSRRLAGWETGSGCLTSMVRDRSCVYQSGRDSGCRIQFISGPTPRASESGQVRAHPPVRCRPAVVTPTREPTCHSAASVQARKRPSAARLTIPESPDSARMSLQRVTSAGSSPDNLRRWGPP